MLHAYICFFIGKKETCQGYSIIFLSDTKAFQQCEFYIYILLWWWMLPCSWLWSICMLLSWSVPLFQSVCPSTPVLFVGPTHTAQSVSLSPLCRSPFLFVHLSISEDLFLHYSLFLSFFYSFFLFMFVSFSRLFCSSCLEALSHPVAGVLPFPLGRPPRPSLWPLNISTSQVGAGASSPCFSSLESCSALSLSLHSFILIPSNASMLFCIYCFDGRFCFPLMLRLSQIIQKFWSSCIYIAFPQIMIITDTICNLGGIKNVLLKLDLYFLIHRPRH